MEYAVPPADHPLTVSRRRIFVDVETTGLLPTHQATEVAWYDLGTDRCGVFIPSHSLAGADPYALEIQGYHERRIGTATFDDGTATASLWNLFHGDGTREGKAAIVAANPGFDAAALSGVFTRAGLAPEPFHYRKLNVSEGAYWLTPGYGDGNTPGLGDVAALFGVLNPHPHQALSDVRTGVVIYRLLERLRQVTTTGVLNGKPVITPEIIAEEIARASHLNQGPRTVLTGATR